MTNNIREYFNQLRDKEIISVSFIQDYFELIFDRGYVRILSEATISSTDTGLLNLPSQQGNWLLVNLINKHVSELNEDGNYVTISIDDGSKIEVNIKISPPGENVQIRVEELSPIFI